MNRRLHITRSVAVGGSGSGDRQIFGDWIESMNFVDVASALRAGHGRFGVLGM